MKIIYKSFLMAVVGGSMITACGFKSDLFIPGEPQTLGQLDSSSIETMKQETLDELQSQDTEIFQTLNPEVIETATEIPDLGVPVMIEPLSEEEIRKNREKNKNE